MSVETKRLTYKERLRKEFTGKGLLEMFLSALFMFVFIFGIRAYRDGMPDVKMTFMMIGVFVVVWPVMSWFWVTLGFIVDKIRAGNEAEEQAKAEDVKKEDVKTEAVTLKASSDEVKKEEVALKASSDDVVDIESKSDKEGADRG